MLFDRLTVEEHLWFFAKLKNCPSWRVKDEIDRMIECIGLTDKRHTQARALSGGMQRKLSVGIALIGDSKVWNHLVSSCLSVHVSIHLEINGNWNSHSLLSSSYITCRQCCFNSSSFVPGGVLPEKLGGGVRPASKNPYPIYDQNLQYSLPNLWLDQKFETLFMTWLLNEDPVFDQRYNKFPSSDQC